MIKYILSLSTFLTVFLVQGQIKNRLIFIGDAGEINHQQETIIPRAAELVIPNKTTVMYLGDNIYPTGMGLPGDKDEVRTQKILQSQYEPMRAQGAPVYFIPGNHDWDRMGKKGLAKVRAQGTFLEAQQDSLLQMVPKNGCPDPIEIPISDQTVLIAFDSEWFVFPHQRSSADISCGCQTETEVLTQLSSLIEKNKNKQILIAAHHPLRTYGVHGGYYSWKDHIFPLRVAKSSLYIPLPVIGSLYPLLRRTVLLNAEDMGHPKYDNYVAGLRNIIKDYPHIIYVSGHDHGLQLIEDKDFLQVVSGSGSKSTYLKKAKDALFSFQEQGFVTIDEMEDQSTVISYYTFVNDQVTLAYTYTKNKGNN